MRRSFRAFTATLLLITPLLASCADITEPAPRPNVERQELLGVVTGLVGTVVNLLGSVVGLLVGGDDANAPAVTKWIGSSGGVLQTGPYTLIVPAGAVSSSTKFGISPTNTGTYSIDLSATRKGLFGTYDVGSRGFGRPVTVKFSYAGADNLKDPSKLVVVYVTINGQAVPQITSIDTLKQSVSTELDHFSKYALVQN